MLRQDHFIELAGKIFQFHPQHVVQHASGDVLNLEVNPLCSYHHLASPHE
jgi:hypothetical protein